MELSVLRYTEEHEWVALDGQIATVGITDHATEELGEIVYVDLPEIGRQIEQMEEFGTVESVKTLSSLFSPVTGEVTQNNSAAIKNPELLNDSPYEDGWLIKIKIADSHEFDNLMTYQEYKQFLENL